MSISVTIPSPGGPVLCGEHLCGTVICGEVLDAEEFSNLALALDADPAVVTTTTSTNITIVVAATGVLELDSGQAIVNPVLMPLVCVDIDLDEITCTSLDLDPLVLQEA